MKGSPDRRQAKAKGGTLLRNVRRGFQSRAVRDLFDDAIKRGWSWKMNGGTHVALTPPGGGKPIILSTTIKGDPPYLADERARVAAEGWQR